MKGRRVGVLSGVLVSLVVWLLWPSGEDPDPERVEQVRSTPARLPDRSTVSPAPIGTATPIPDEPHVGRPDSGCADRIDDLWEACDVELLANGCRKLGRHRRRIEKNRRALVDDLRACGLDDSANVRVDCTDYPCLVLGRRPVPPTLGECLRGRMPANQRPLGDFVTVAWNVEDAASAKGELKRQLVRAQEEQRLAIAARSVSDGATLCEALEMLSPEADCTRVAKQMGCGERAEDAVSVEVAEQYLTDVDTLVEELDEACPAFRESGLELDCLDLPCALVAENWDAGPAGLERWLTSVCSTTRFGSAPRIIGRADSDPTLVTFLWPEGWADEPSLKRRFEERSMARTFDLLTRREGSSSE